MTGLSSRGHEKEGSPDRVAPSSRGAAVAAPAKAVAIVNGMSGSLRTLDKDALAGSLRQHMAGADCDVTVLLTDEIGHEAALAQAEASDAELIIAAGGDGTVSSAAELALRTKRVLAVLPGGTMNLFARTLGMPLDIDEAMAALATGHEGAADVARANGRLFLNLFTIGFQPTAIRLRERTEYASRWGKLFATARALASVCFKPPRFVVRLSLDDGSVEQKRLSNLSVSCNPLGAGHLPFADRYDAGVLGVYPTHPVSPLKALRLVIDLSRGAWPDNPDVELDSARTIRIEMEGRRRHRHAAIDGEIVELDRETVLAIEPTALRVWLPGPPVAAW